MGAAISAQDGHPPYGAADEVSAADHVPASMNGRCLIRSPGWPASTTGCVRCVGNRRHGYLPVRGSWRPTSAGCAVLCAGSVARRPAIQSPDRPSYADMLSRMTPDARACSPVWMNCRCILSSFPAGVRVRAEVAEPISGIGDVCVVEPSCDSALPRLPYLVSGGEGSPPPANPGSVCRFRKRRHSLIRRRRGTPNPVFRIPPAMALIERSSGSRLAPRSPSRVSLR